MNDQATNRSGVVVAGFGSPHGDDQAGWRVIARLARRRELPARIAPIQEGTQLIHELDGCQKLIVVDACRSSGPVGTISRFCWPDPRIRQLHDRSTHEIGLCSALELAEQLGKLPPHVEVFGIEIGDLDPIGGMSAEVLQAVVKLEAVILAGIDEVVHA